MQTCTYMQRNNNYDLFYIKLSSKKLKPLQHHMESGLILLTSTTTYDKVESSFFLPCVVDMFLSSCHDK